METFRKSNGNGPNRDKTDAKMKDLNDIVFRQLFKDVCKKCFGDAVTSALSETDSKLLSNRIFDQTGLVIGVKSIRNYSLYIFDSREGRKENPSVATLDTLARYVLEAPYTDEVTRRNSEDHHPYWFRYREQSVQRQGNGKIIPVPWKKVRVGAGVLAVVMGLVLVFKLSKPEQVPHSFTDNFNSVHNDSLVNKGWICLLKDSMWWNKRGEKPGHLSLYTLRGDNWSNETNAEIRNLLVREIPADCFSAEIHLTDFFPSRNWQQAGILLAEDQSFQGKVLRISISYNDFHGGYTKPPEIIIQGISSSESGRVSNPEEFAHVTLYNVDSGREKLVKSNLSRAALKIEKKQNLFRFLYATGEMESFAFREAASRDFDIQPKYIGLFAIQGLADQQSVIPASFDSFTYAAISCRPPD
jgi:hypothetical protein